MEAKEQERWRVLCEQATREEDPKRLIELVQEINQLLDPEADKKSSQSNESRHRAAS